jgi:hypothetical protein
MRNHHRGRAPAGKSVRLDAEHLPHKSFRTTRQVPRFPKSSAAAFLTDRLAQRNSELIRDLQDDLDDALQDAYRAGYCAGYEEGTHEICHDDKQAAGPLPATAECDDEKI